MPSAALLKATLIAAARSVPNDWIYDQGLAPAKPAPTYEQGFGFPVLDDALYFPGDRARTRIADVPLAQGLAQNETATLRLNVNAGTPLKVALVWTDPAGVPARRFRSDAGARQRSRPPRDRRFRHDPPRQRLTPSRPARSPQQRGSGVIESPPAGLYTISVTASRLGSGPRQSYALVVTGDLTDAIPSMPNPIARTRAARH